MKKKINTADIFSYIFLIICMVLVAFPIIYAIGGSFKSSDEFLVGGTSIFPNHLDLQNYILAWKQANFALYTLNSVTFTLASVVLTVITTAMAGYVLSRADFKGKKLLLGMMGFTIFLMGAVTIYPIFNLCKKLGMLNSMWGMIIAQVAGGQALYSVVVMGYCSGISKEIDEAAQIDGASFFKTFTHIIFPIIKPISATVALLSFKDAWNSFMMPLAFTMSKPKLRPLTVGVVMLKDQGDGIAAWNLMLAGTVLSLIPILVAYLFLNKYFISGITDGAIKG